MVSFGRACLAAILFPTKIGQAGTGGVVAQALLRVRFAWNAAAPFTPMHRSATPHTAHDRRCTRVSKRLFPNLMPRRRTEYNNPRITWCEPLVCGSPCFDSDTLDGAEVCVAGYQRQIVLLGMGGNPNVIFWDRTPLCP